MVFIQIEVIHYLQTGDEPIHLAAQTGSKEILQLLIEDYKVSPDTPSLDVCQISR